MTDTTDTIANAVATITAFMRSHKCKTIGQAYDLPQFPMGALHQALPGYEYPEISGLSARQLSNRAIPRYRDDHARRHLVAGGRMYVCRVCGKRTRDTGGGEDSCQLCWTCYEEGGLENEHSDSGHPQPVAGCPRCRELAQQELVSEHENCQHDQQVEGCPLCDDEACADATLAGPVAPVEPVFDQTLVAQLDRALVEQQREIEADHGNHVHHEPGCGLCEGERLADGVAVEQAAAGVTGKAQPATTQLYAIEWRLSLIQQQLEALAENVTAKGKDMSTAHSINLAVAHLEEQRGDLRQVERDLHTGRLR